MNGHNDQSRLQSLLLAQTLASCASSSSSSSSTTTTTAVFDHVSTQLKQSPFFASDASDPSAFTPESLKNLYLSLAKDEARREVNGARSSPRRKTPSASKSPRPDAVPDAQYGRRAAEMVPHLFDDYRSQIIREIRDEERKYKALTDELKALNDGKDVANVALNSDAHHAGALLEPAAAAGNIAAPVEATPPHGHVKAKRSETSIDSNISHDESKAEGTGKSRPTSSSAPELPADRSSINPSPAALQGAPRQPPYASSHSPIGRAILPHLAQGPVLAAQAPQQQLQARSNGADRHASSHAVPTSPRAPRPGDVYAQENSSATSFNDGWRYAQHQSSPARGLPAGQQQQQSPYTQSNAAVHQHAHSHAQQRGGVMLPPFQLSTQPCAADPRHPSAAPHGKRVPEPLQLNQVRGATSETPHQQTPSNQAYTPLSGPNGSRLAMPDTFISPGSSTRWKQVPGVNERAAPRARSVSPLSEPEDAGTGVSSRPLPSGRRTRRGRGAASAQTRQTGVRGAARTGSMRGLSPSARSESTSSQLDEPFRHPSALRQRNEAPGTPGAPSVSGDETVTSTTKQQPRRGAAQRKRAMSTTETNLSVDEDTAMPPRSSAVAQYQPPPNTVVATRNFAKVSATLLNIISSHKHASLFADRITNKQADGYEDIVRVGQDLKSIRAAVKNGERAVNAATAEEASPGGGATSGSVILPATEAVLPPKSIVNSAQLEAEVYRMFANCVMFNAGNEDYVVPAQEMFADVEREIQNWRSTEGVQDSAADDEAGPSTKRRRL